jgi:cysteine desulfurase
MWVYLDNAAGTRPYPEVLGTIASVIEDHYGNASADNSLGHDARMIIDCVTNNVAMDINCDPDEIIWTSGACEANSLAIIGTLDVNDMIFCTTKLEHTSTIEAMRDCESYVKYFMPTDNFGNINIAKLENSLSEISSRYGKPPFVSISYANSEIGVIQDIKTIASIVHKYHGLLHVDATQMYPWRSIDVKDLGIDLMSVSGQKMHCVKGIGFLYVRNGIRLRPLIYGSQQDGRRGGTYPTHLIAAFGAALETTRMNDDGVIVWMLRNNLLNRLLQIEGVHLNGPAVTANRLPNNISLTIDGVSADRLTTLCDMMGVIIAKGSACKSYEPKPSEALLAIGLTEEQALNTIRISLGMMNTIDEIEYAADIITNMIQRIREDE